MGDQESQTDEGTVTDEQVLADPSAFTVEQVLDVFTRAGEDQVAAAKDLEAGGQNRKGIAEWKRPTPPQVEEEPVFSRDRILGPDGPRIAGAPRHVIVGALYGDDAKEFTRAQIQKKVKAFLERPVKQRPVKQEA